MSEKTSGSKPAQAPPPAQGPADPRGKPPRESQKSRDKGGGQRGGKATKTR